MYCYHYFVHISFFFHYSLFSIIPFISTIAIAIAFVIVIVIVFAIVIVIVFVIVISFCHCYCCCFCHYYYDHFSSLITMIINFIVIIVVIYIYFIYHNCFLILLLFSFFLKLSWTDSCKTQTLCSPLPLVLMFFKLEKIKKKENTWKIKKKNFKTEKTQEAQ